MFKNYFKTAFRFLLKNKTFSFINILGLAIGIACAGLIFLWVEDEVRYDDFNVKKDRLYFVRVNQKYDTYTATFASTPLIPSFASIAVAAAKTAESRDHVSQVIAPKLTTRRALARNIGESPSGPPITTA